MPQRFSQNGWPAYATTEHYTRFTAAGQGWWAANADVATVFTSFIERFDAEIEEITGPILDDWSYANRLVRGSTSTVSNHGSATACDLNALQHGRGSRGTYSQEEVRTLHRIRDDIVDDAGRPVLRLGEDYQNAPVDGMHVEINATPAQVAQAARRIRARRQAEAEAMGIGWNDVHKYTAADAAGLGDPKREGEEYGANVVIRGYTPAMARLRRELDARLDAQDKAVQVLRSEVKEELAEIKALLTPNSGK